ncbi:MAG TPA: hypothetical protein PKX15_01615 [Bacteroidales bacterium]|mgnify:CR=1 FL=1|jgi:hypothetical protein|nr:hypothetical protein [Bacteroidales bacterium]HOS15712.1 hypothetical protein [Bacteroidales bacterium]
MSNNFTLSKKESTSKEKIKTRPYRETIISLLNYSKSIEVKRSKHHGTILFINN